MLVPNRRRTPEGRLRERTRQATRYAVKTGRLTKPDACSCGKSPVEAHHADYSDPMNVEWLCKLCHGGKRRGRPLERLPSEDSDGTRDVRLDVKTEIVRRELTIATVSDTLDIHYGRLIQILNGYVDGNEEENGKIRDFMEEK